MSEITAFCESCRQEIAAGCGFIGVRHSEIVRARQAGHGDGSTGALVEDFLNGPGEAVWHTFHFACDNGADRDYYQIGSERIATWPAVAWWTSHLMEKTWLAVTDWDTVLRELSDGGGRRRLVAIAAAAA